MKNNRIAIGLTFVFTFTLFVLVLSPVSTGAKFQGEPNPAEVMAAAGTAFTYQGRLTDGGTPANGTYNFRFNLWAEEGKTTLLGTYPPSSTVPIEVTDGYFTTTLDFGIGIFNGDERWLEIEVNGVLLTPLQSITPAPYAIYAQTAPWSGLSGVPAGLEDGDDDTTYGPGFGLGLTGTTFNVNPTIIQSRVSGNCGEGSAIRQVNMDGGVVCEQDDDTNTTYTAGEGLVLVGTEFRVDSSTLQTRVGGSCQPGSTIRVINEDGTVICEPHDAYPVYSDTRLDSDGDVGYFSSITIGVDGLPIISYYREDSGNLKVAHCNDMACTSAEISPVDTLEDVGQDTSITIGRDGMAIISYYDVTNTALKIAHCNDVACTSAESSILDADGIVGWDTSIAIGVDGLPIISYYRSDTGNLKVAHCDDVTCTSVSKTPIDTVGDVGEYSSITIGIDGLPIIAYTDHTLYYLKVAHCNDVVCSSATVSVVYDSAQIDAHPFIAIGVDGLPIISHLEYTFPGPGYLILVHCENIYCSNSTINSYAIGVSIRASITIGTDGLPIIIFSDTDHFLIAAHCSDITCSSVRMVPLVTNHNNAIFPDITIGLDGMPIISYYFYDDTWGESDLNVLHCSNRFCLPYWRQW